MSADGEILRVYLPRCLTGALRGRNLSVLRFYRHSLFVTTSGGHIFLCVKKDMEERHAKGLQSRPLDSGFLYGGSEGRRADFLRVRIGAINAI